MKILIAPLNWGLGHASRNTIRDRGLERTVLRRGDRQCVSYRLRLRHRGLSGLNPYDIIIVSVLFINGTPPSAISNVVLYIYGLIAIAVEDNAVNLFGDSSAVDLLTVVIDLSLAHRHAGPITAVRPIVYVRGAPFQSVGKIDCDSFPLDRLGRSGEGHGVGWAIEGVGAGEVFRHVVVFTIPSIRRLTIRLRPIERMLRPRARHCQQQYENRK